MPCITRDGLQPVRIAFRWKYLDSAWVTKNAEGWTLGHVSLRKQPTFRDATTGFPARNNFWETTAEMFHYPDLGSDSDWSKREGNLLQPIRSTTQICHQYGISAIVCQMSSRGNPDGEVPKWRLFVQTRAVHVVYLLTLKIFHLQFFAWLRNYFSFYFLFLSSIGNS